MTQNAPAAFVSYSRVDSDFALRLASDLKSAGASVWLDQLDIVPGQLWDRAVEDALANCPSMLVILSPDSVESTNVMDEVSFALEKKKTVVPVVYRDCNVPFRLRRLQYVDITQSYDRGLKELLKTLASGQTAVPLEEDRRKQGAESRRQQGLDTRAEAEERQRNAQAQQARDEIEPLERAEPGGAHVTAQAARRTQQGEPGSEAPQRANPKLRLAIAVLALVVLIGICTHYVLSRHSSLLTLNGHTDSVTIVAWNPEGNRLATGSRDKTVKLWDTETGTQLLTLNGHGYLVTSVAWSPDGKWLATGSWDGTAKVLDAETGKESLTLRGHRPPVESVAWSPDGKRVLTGSGDKTAKVWDAETGKELRTLNAHDYPVTSVAWSADGKRLATGSGDKTARVWDADTGTLMLTLTGHRNTVFAVAWSPDGKRLATGSQDSTAEVWDAETGKELLHLGGHSDWVMSVAWSPDGKRLATGSADKTARLWDAETGKLLRTLSGHRDVVLSVAWSPDGKRLATGSADKTAKVWDARR